MSAVIDELGTRHYGWTVERAAQPPPGRSTSQWWLCRCDCGHAEVIRSTELRSGYKRACHNADEIVEPEQSACPARLWHEYPCLNDRAGHAIHFYDIRKQPSEGTTP